MLSLPHPHGGILINQLDERPVGVEKMERIILSSRELLDLDMIACGALSPLKGFMGSGDYHSVLENMRLGNGLPWSLPVTLSVEKIPSHNVVALANSEGEIYGSLEVEEVFPYEKEREVEICFGTKDRNHPGVERVLEQKSLCLAGEIKVFHRPKPLFPGLSLDPAITRKEFRERGWKSVVGFQTRNPIHRAHEYITKIALEIVDGLLIHPLVGDTKSDDVPASVRIDCYKALIENYYPKNRVILSSFPAAMRYAGPREAIWHALIRKNYGCSHFIVGRDHAGVGNYYGTYEAQEIFDVFSKEELGITILKFDHSFFCRLCEAMATTKTCPHSANNHLIFSGTQIREMLGKGEIPSPSFTRPEVAKILIEAYAA
jgi:sulfate adenylyltransferase